MLTRVPILKYGVGLEYLQNGAESTVDGSYSLGYVSIPIHIRAKLGPVFALVGVAANFKVTEAKSGVFDSPGYLDSPGAFDLPLVAGFGFSFLMFSVEARYHYGTQVTNTRNEFNVSTDFTTSYLQLGVSAEF